FGRTICCKLTSATAMGCIFTTKSGGIWKNRGGTMTRGRGTYRFASLAVGLWMIVSMGVSFAQQVQPSAASAEPAKAEAPAPNLPVYFTATNDPQKPAWP